MFILTSIHHLADINGYEWMNIIIEMSALHFARNEL